MTKTVKRQEPKLQSKPELKQQGVKQSEVSKVELEILDNGNAVIPLSWGKVEVREPKARQLMEVEGWMSNYPEQEALGVSLIVARVFWSCSMGKSKTPQLKTFDTFLDSLELEDFERLAIAAQHFRAFFEHFARKAEQSTSVSI